jgi:hypothetical protein
MSYLRLNAWKMRLSQRLRSAAETPNPSVSSEKSNGDVQKPHDTPANAAAPKTSVTRYHFHIDERFAGPDTTDIDVFSVTMTAIAATDSKRANIGGNEGNVSCRVPRTFPQL